MHVNVLRWPEHAFLKLVLGSETEQTFLGAWMKIRLQRSRIRQSRERKKSGFRHPEGLLEAHSEIAVS